MTTDIQPTSEASQIVLYKPNDSISLEVKIDAAHETVWLTQQQIADLFGTKQPAISKHLSNIYKSGELDEDSTYSILEYTAADGKVYKTQFYNLDAIISVGYRVNSVNATAFRRWATNVLRDYQLKGYTINRQLRHGSLTRVQLGKSHMPRTARQQSDTGVYHAILRGVNKQQIFECSEDYQKFLQILRLQTQPQEDALGNPLAPHCAIYAYCQMGNHVHLLLKEVSEPIADIMKRIASSYVFYYNHKYDRCGHLFQERFRSQPCDDMSYFITLLRYIHQNPLKPGLVQDIAQYPWSSWQELTPN